MHLPTAQEICPVPEDLDGQTAVQNFLGKSAILLAVVASLSHHLARGTSSRPDSRAGHRLAGPLPAAALGGLAALVPANLMLSQSAAALQSEPVAQVQPEELVTPADTGAAVVFRSAAAELKALHVSRELDWRLFHGRLCLPWSEPSETLRSYINGSAVIRAECIRAARSKLGAWATSTDCITGRPIGALQADGENRRLVEYFLTDAVVRMNDRRWDELANDIQVLVVLARLGCNRFAFNEPEAPHTMRHLSLLSGVAVKCGAPGEPRSEPVKAYLRSLDAIDPLRAKQLIRVDLQMRDAYLNDVAKSGNVEMMLGHRWIQPAVLEAGETDTSAQKVHALRQELRKATVAVVAAFDASHETSVTAESWRAKAEESIKVAPIGDFLRTELRRVVEVLQASDDLSQLVRAWKDDGDDTAARRECICDVGSAVSWWVPTAIMVSRDKVPSAGPRQVPSAVVSAEVLDAVASAAAEEKWPLKELHLRAMPLGEPQELQVPGLAAGLSEVGRALTADAMAALQARDDERAVHRIATAFMLARRLADQRHPAYALGAAKIVAGLAKARTGCPEWLTAIIDTELNALAEEDPVGLVALLRKGSGAGENRSNDAVGTMERLLWASMPTDVVPAEADDGLRLAKMVAESAKLGAWECGLDWANVAWVLPTAELETWLRLVASSEGLSAEVAREVIRKYVGDAADRIVQGTSSRAALANWPAVKATGSDADSD